MRWQEVDFREAIWTIPAERMKAKQSHRVPLTQRALGILNQLKGNHETLVFPSPRAQVMFSDMALTVFLRRINAISNSPDRHATAHGFRSSFRDWCSENGYPRDLAERSLAHTIANKVEAAYHRTDLLEQRRPMMQAWENHCRTLIANPNSMAEALANSLDLRLRMLNRKQTEASDKY
jgi:integrase